MNFPSNLLYTAHDEWVLREGNKIRVGISDYAQDALGELVHVELPKLGATVQAGAAVAEVESVKAVAEVYTPVSGKIVAINDDLDGNENLVNQDPYGAGWLFEIEATDASGLDALLDVAAYKSKVG
jgi:glycine cleavage system H protein